jgi:hypothetical protein
MLRLRLVRRDSTAYELRDNSKHRFSPSRDSSSLHPIIYGTRDTILNRGALGPQKSSSVSVTPVQQMMEGQPSMPKTQPNLKSTSRLEIDVLQKHSEI